MDPDRPWRVFPGPLRYAVLAVLAVATGLAAGDLRPQAIGTLGTLLVWLILAPVTSWSGVAAVAVYHGSVWTLAFTGGDRWAVFGVSLFMAVAQALNLGLWSLDSARARYARVKTSTALPGQPEPPLSFASGWT
jgi:hypothetical protein